MGKYYKQLYYNINEQLLKEEVLSILEKHPLHLWDKQLCLTHPKNCNDTWYHGSGSAYYITENNKDFKQYNREALLKETDFTELNNEFCGYKMVFVLYAVEGYKHQEIAEMLNITEGTSKSQLALIPRKNRQWSRDAIPPIRF